MADGGYIYILINPSMEGLIKVGKTTKDPKERASELSKATGVPTPFIVAYQACVNNCSKAEMFVHIYLENKGYRVTSNREFFNAPLTEAVDAIFLYKQGVDKENEFEEQFGNKSIEADEFVSDNQWTAIEEEAESYLLGIGNHFKDDKKALQLYIRAVKLGSPTACDRVGFSYEEGIGTCVDYEKALEYYQIGVSRGVYEHYGSMFLVYVKMNDRFNALKSWDLYMENLDKTKYIIPSYCSDYIEYIYDNNLPVKHIEKLLPDKDKIMNEQNREPVLQYMKYIFSQPCGSPLLLPKEFVAVNKRSFFKFLGF